MSSLWMMKGLVPALTLGAWVGTQPLWAQEILQEQGTIAPARATYTFTTEVAELVTITLTSEDFDPVLELQDADGNLVGRNDDFGGSLNSTLILFLPEASTYTVTASSFGEDGGDYSLMVRSATPYETLYSEAQGYQQEEDFENAIASYTAAIELDGEQIPAYLGRAETYISQVYTQQGETFSGPEDIPTEIKLAIIDDFERAADLMEADGNLEWARSLREQVALLRQENP